MEKVPLWRKIADDYESGVISREDLRELKEELKRTWDPDNDYESEEGKFIKALGEALPYMVDVDIKRNANPNIVYTLAYRIPDIDILSVRSASVWHGTVNQILDAMNYEGDLEPDYVMHFVYEAESKGNKQLERAAEAAVEFYEYTLIDYLRKNRQISWNIAQALANVSNLSELEHTMEQDLDPDSKKEVLALQRIRLLRAWKTEKQQYESSMGVFRRTNL